ncbi:MAG: DUF58 domain-containing protein [Pyrinomonadaceae bacterium]
MQEAFKNFSWRDVRNAVFGLIVVFGGIGLAGVTVWAQYTSNPRLAGVAAAASLVFVVLILLFVVPPLARSASKEVSQIDLPIELTSGGLIFLGIVAIVAFAAWNTGNNLLFLVLSFLLATLVVSFVLGGANLKKLEAKVRFPEAIFAATPVVFAVTLNNRKFVLPAFSVTLALRGAMTDDAFGGRKFSIIQPPVVLARFLRLPWLRRTVGYFIHVPRRSEAEQQTEQLFAKRGRFIIKDFELSTKFPFGFWQRRRRLGVRETEIFVFPQLANVRDILPAVSRQAGRFTSLRRGAGQDLLGLREYQPSDDLRHVDWKATARTGNMTVREYSTDDERRVTIAFDSSFHHEKQSPEMITRFEHGVSLTAALLTRLASEKTDVRLIIDNPNIDFGADKAHLYESLRRLATIEPQFEEKNSEYFNSLSGYLPMEDLIILLTAKPEKFSAMSHDLQIIPF